jgi:hypothetical protein
MIMQNSWAIKNWNNDLANIMASFDTHAKPLNSAAATYVDVCKRDGDAISSEFSNACSGLISQYSIFSEKYAAVSSGLSALDALYDTEHIL